MQSWGKYPVSFKAFTCGWDRKAESLQERNQNLLYSNNLCFEAKEMIRNVGKNVYQGIYVALNDWIFEDYSVVSRDLRFPENERY